MKCKQASEITGYLQGEGSEEERLMLCRHYEQCDSCARELQQFERTMGSLTQLDTVEPSPDFKRRVEAAFLKAHPQFAQKPRFRLLPKVAVAAGLLLAAVGAFFILRPTDKDTRMGHMAPEPATATPEGVHVPPTPFPKTIGAGAWGESLPYDRRLLAAVTTPSAPDKDVASALAWLVGRQESDGSWKGNDAGETIDLTGLSVLALGARQEVAVKKGIEFLISRQRDSGAIGGGSPESHAIATLALQEAAIRTKNVGWAKAAAKAVALIAQQNQDGPWGGGAVAGWQYHVLRLATASGDRSLIPALVKGYGVAAAGLWADPAPLAERWASEAASLLERSPLTGTLPANYVRNDLRRAYFGTELLRPLQGEAWTKWWSPLRAKLQKTQAPDGSWPADFEQGRSQVYVTALCSLILQTPARLPAMEE
jgi:hypothetical protein